MLPFDKGSTSSDPHLPVHLETDQGLCWEFICFHQGSQSSHCVGLSPDKSTKNFSPMS